MSTAPQIHLVRAAAAAQPEDWLSRKDFLRLTGWSLQWLSAQVRQGNILTRDTQRKLANGRLDVEFAASSLPPKALAAWEAEQRKAEPAQTALSLFAPQAVAAAAAPRLPRCRKEEKAVSQGMQLLQPILDYRSNPGRYETLRLSDGTAVRSLSSMIRYRAESLSGKVSERKLWRMLKRHDEGGAGELLRKKRSDAGSARSLTEDSKFLLASLYLGDGFVPGQTVQACHAALVTQAELVGLTADTTPSYDAVRRFLGQAPASLTIFARKGKKRFGETILPYVTRAYNEYSNQIWVSDHMIADVEVANDIFHGDPKLPIGAPFRPRLSAVIDYRSRLVVGYSWAAEESSTSIGAAIRNAVLEHGPADHFYCDNGKAYIKTAKGAQPGYLAASGPADWWAEEMGTLEHSVLSRLGMRVTHCIPHHPQSKHVERFFRTVHAQFCSMWPTYTGGSPDRRPDATTALMAVHRKAVRSGDALRSMHPPASLFAQAFRAWLEQYHAAVHTGKGMDGRSPAECFAQERNPAQRPAPPAEDLAILFYDRCSRKVDSCAITLDTVRFVARGALATARMAARHGQNVTVAFHRSTPEQVAVLDESGRVLCLLDRDVPIAFAPEDPATQQAIAASMQQRNGLTRDTREQREAITRRRRRIGASTSIELLAAKTLPVAIAPTDPILSPTVRHQPKQRLVSKPRHAADIAASLLED